MNINVNLSVTEIVAIWGGLTGTLGLAVAFTTLKRDEPSVCVKASYGLIVPSMQIDSKVKIIIKATNGGRRAVTLTSAGFDLKNGQQIVFVNPVNLAFPVELKEGQSCSTYVDKDELLKEMKDNNTQTTRVWFMDAMGKKYKGRFKLKT